MSNTKKPAAKGRLVVLALVAAVMAGGAWFMSGRSAQTEVSAPVQATAVAANGTVSISVQAISIAEPAVTTTLRNRSAGYVRFALPEGTLVKAGDPVVAFDDTDLRKALSQAELNSRQARMSLERAKAAEAKAGTDLETKRNLLDAKAISQEQYEASRDALATAIYSTQAASLSVEQSDLSLDQARRDLADTVLKAGYDAVVSRPMVAAGDFASANTVLASLVDLSRILFRAEVDEYDIGKLRAGMSVTVRVPALQDASFKARIEGISPIAEVINNISVFKVGVLVDNKEGNLRPGMSADVVVQVASGKGLVVPAKAITTVRDRSYIDLPGQDGEVETRRVTIGLSDGRTTLVTEGLEEGETVYLQGTYVTAPVASAPGSSGTSIIPITVPGQGR
ncbi:MAG: efflux RND transporter periplasmic adaptor subunit [Spirochaetota bacterium]